MRHYFRNQSRVKKILLSSKAYDFTHEVRRKIEKYRAISLPKDNPDARPFVRMKAWYRIAPKYKLTGCIVEKSMCTMLQSIMCYLYDSVGFERAQRTISEERWPTRFCAARNEPDKTQEKELLMPYPTTNIFIVRDPLERLLSGFMDKCVQEKSVCFGCGGRILCVLEGLHREVMLMSRRYYHIVNRMSGLIGMSYETQHMAPQTWYCDLFDEYNNHIFIRYGERGIFQEDMRSDFLEILRDHGVEENKLATIKKSLWSKFPPEISNPFPENTKHTTKGNPVRESIADEIRRSPKHLEMFMQIYKYDYEIFGFTPPIKIDS